MWILWLVRSVKANLLKIDTFVFLRLRFRYPKQYQNVIKFRFRIIFTEYVQGVTVNQLSPFGKLNDKIIECN